MVYRLPVTFPTIEAVKALHVLERNPRCESLKSMIEGKFQYVPVGKKCVRRVLAVKYTVNVQVSEFPSTIQLTSTCMYVCACACVRACMRACICACVSACVCGCGCIL